MLFGKGRAKRAYFKGVLCFVWNTGGIDYQKKISWLGLTLV